MAPKELEKVLYFAASIDHLDRRGGAPRRTSASSRRRSRRSLDSYEAEREQRTQELSESIERRVAYIETGEQSASSRDEDQIWAEGTGSASRS